MIQAYFYLEHGPSDPLGEMEYWIEAVPRRGDTVTVSVISRANGRTKAAARGSRGGPVDLREERRQQPPGLLHRGNHGQGKR